MNDFFRPPRVIEPKPLRDYQIDGINRIFEVMRAGQKPVYQLATGGGKGRMIAELFRLAHAKGRRAAVVVPWLSLIKQTWEVLANEGLPEELMSVEQGDHPLCDRRKPYQICSTDTLVRRKTLPQVDLVIFDEVHRHSMLYARWMAEAPHIKFLGVTATPWAKGMHETWDCLLIGETISSLIARGFLSPFRAFAPSQPDLSEVKISTNEHGEKDYNEGQLSKAMQKPLLIADVVNTWLENGEGRPTFGFGVDCAHAQALQQRFIAAGVPCGYIDAYTEVEGDGGREDQLAQLARQDLKVIMNVGTLTTGVDAPFVSCLSLARPTKSEMLYCLDSETQILTSHGWKGMGEVRTGDCAATLTDLDSRAGAWARVEAVIERDMESTESWVEYSAPRANFRVTDKHTMIFRGANENCCGVVRFKIGNAAELQKCKGGAYLPTSVQIDQPGVPLTDDELYFIGMMMTDGSWTGTTGYISQSERHPEIIDRIEKCLRGCGIGYSRRRVAPPPEDAVIPERFRRWTFNFSVGKPRAHARIGRGPQPTKNHAERVDGITGFQHLLPFLDKDLSPALMALSRSQFLVFLQGFNDGDGFKLKSPSVNWTPKTWTLCSARQMVADRIQALAAIHGFTCNIRSEHGTRKNPIWLISITPQDWRHVGGYSSAKRGPRPQIEMKPATSERVWCVQTETGTIVTRRRGKVTVMGNCQIVGRVLRTHPGKRDAILFDHGSTMQSLGLPDEIFYEDFIRDDRPDKDAEKRKERLPKPCPVCTYLLAPGTRVCPSCGHERKPVSSVVCEEGELVEIGVGKKKKTKEAADHDTKQRWFSGLLYIARERGYKDGWAANKYREKFEVWPRGLSDQSAFPDAAISSWVKASQIRWAKRREKDANHPMGNEQ